MPAKRHAQPSSPRLPKSDTPTITLLTTNRPTGVHTSQKPASALPAGGGHMRRSGKAIDQQTTASRPTAETKATQVVKIVRIVSQEAV